MQHQVQNTIVQSPTAQQISNEVIKFEKSVADNFKAALLFSQWQRQK